MPTTERGGVGAWEPLRLDAVDSSNCFNLCELYETNKRCFDEDPDIHGTPSTEDDWRVCTICKEGVVDEAICSLHIVEDSEWPRGLIRGNSRRDRSIVIAVFHCVSV